MRARCRGRSRVDLVDVAPIQGRVAVDLGPMSGRSRVGLEPIWGKSRGRYLRSIWHRFGLGHPAPGRPTTRLLRSRQPASPRPSPSGQCTRPTRTGSRPPPVRRLLRGQLARPARRPADQSRNVPGATRARASRRRPPSSDSALLRASGGGAGKLASTGTCAGAHATRRSPKSHCDIAARITTRQWPMHCPLHATC